MAACDRPQVGGYSSGLFAPRLNSRDFRELWRQLISGKRLNGHLDEAHERTTKIGFGFTAPIDNHADRQGDTAMCADDVDCLLHASAARDDIFHNDEFFGRRNVKTAPQDELAFVFFDKDMAFA